jgi:hypothetical protein
MKTLLLAGIAVLSLTTGTAHAAEKRLPKAFWGKWCVMSSATGGGSPRVWEYSRSRAECDAQDMPKEWRSQGVTIGPYRVDGCKITKLIEWQEENAPTYFMTYRCKDGEEVSAKFSLDRDENSLTGQRMRVKN